MLNGKKWDEKSSKTNKMLAKRCYSPSDSNMSPGTEHCLLEIHQRTRSFHSNSSHTCVKWKDVETRGTGGQIMPLAF